MNAVSYVRQSLEAAVRLARFDKTAIGDFDTSFEGFFKSFAAMVLCIPLYLIQMAAQRYVISGMENAPALEPIGPGMFAVDLFFYAVEWIAFPLAMIAIVPLINAGPRYVPFIIAHNWASCLVLAAQVLPSLFLLAGLQFLATATALPLLIAALVYLWLVAREGLQTSAASAAGIVVLEILLSVLVQLGTASLQSAT
jgi:hypothetical protein